MIRWNGIGKRIQKLREEYGETQQQTADALGVKRETINQWESETRNIKADHLSLLARHFQVTSDYLLGLEVEKTHEQELTLNQTGLSSEAIRNINTLEPGDPLFKQWVISRFLENGKASRRFFRDMDQVTCVCSYVRSELDHYGETIQDALSNLGYDDKATKYDLQKLLDGNTPNSLQNLRRDIDGALYAFSITCAAIFTDEREALYKAIAERELEVSEKIAEIDKRQNVEREESYSRLLEEIQSKQNNTRKEQNDG